MPFNILKTYSGDTDDSSTQQTHGIWNSRHISLVFIITLVLTSTKGKVEI